MRILFLTLGYPPRDVFGAATYTRNMAHALAERGHDVHVLECNPWRASADEDDEGVFLHRRRTVRIRGYRHILRWISDPASRTTEAWRMRWNAERWSDDVVRRVVNAYQYFHAYRALGTRYDVVESPGLSLELFFGLLRPAPVVVNLHTPPGFERSLDPRDGGMRARTAFELDRASAFRADLLTSGSALMVRALTDSGWLDGHEPWVVPLTIDPTPWSSIPSARASGPVVLSVGRSDHRKGPDVLVRAAATLRDQVDALHVMFVGTTPDGNRFHDRVVELATDLGAPCSFEGRIGQDDLFARYASARVVAIPSRSESFSLAGLEAMAAGRAVVCTSRVGLSEWLDGTGAGAVVPSEDPAALAGALKLYLEDPAMASAAGEAARKLVASRFAPDRIASAREAAYEEAIRRWRNRAKGR